MKCLRSLLCLAAVAIGLTTSSSHAAVPSAPENVQSFWLVSESLLTWSEVPGAASYNVYRSDDTNTTWSLVTSGVSVPRFRDLTLQFLPSYYVVTAVNGDGEGTASQPSTVAFAEPAVISVYQPSRWDGTLSPTNAIICAATSDMNGAQGMLDWGLDATNYTSFAINTNFLGVQTFALTNLSPLTSYLYRLTSLSSNHTGASYLGYFETPDTNHRPVLVSNVNYYSFSPETAGASISYHAIDTDFPPQTITYRITSTPTNGTLSGPYSGWSLDWGLFESLSYQPDVGARGLDHLTVVANDGMEDSIPMVITLSNWLNRVPTAGFLQVTAAEDTPVTVQLNNFDSDGDAVSFSVGLVSGGTLSGTGPDFIFTPATNSFGDYVGSFTYYVTDGYGTNQGSVAISVTPVNDKPGIRTNLMPAIATWEDESVSFWLGVYDVDWTDGYELIQVTPPAHGTLSGTVWNPVYSPATNFFGTDYFTISVREGNGATSDPVTLSVEVQPRNDPPVALDQDVTTLEDTPIVITPTATDIDSPALFTFQIHWGGWPTNGWVEQTGTNFIYHPREDFTGTDTFQFDAMDDFGFMSWDHPGTIRIQILPAGEPPVAMISWATSHQDAFVNSFFRVSDVDGDALVCEVLAPPTNGTVMVTGTNFHYQPNPGFQGNDGFTFRAFDGEFYSGVTNAVIWVTGPNTPPTASAQTINTVQNTPVWNWLLMNDADGDPLTAILVDPPQHGTVVFDGIAVTYTPANDFYGADSFTYQPFDGVTNGNTTLVTISVMPPNRPPVANNSIASGAEDSTININFSASDPDGNSLAYEILSGPTNGVLTGSGATRSYQPNLNFNGADSIQFRAFDGQYYSAAGTVSITVTPVNDPPVATNTTVLDYEDYPVTLLLGGTDVDNGITTCTFTIITPPAHGTLSSGNRVRTYTPAHNYNGPDSFTFQISDGAALSGIATVSINVLPMNDAPFPQWQVITNYEDNSFAITLTGTDVDGDALTFGIAVPPHDGTLSGTPPNLIYTPNPNFNSGSPVTSGDFFLFWVSDGQISTSNGVSIVLLPVNDAPVASNQSYNVPEDGVVLGNLAGTDVENDPLTFRVVTPPVHGTVTLSSSNSFEYRPVVNYSGVDSFTVVANDGAADSASATISLTVAGSNDAPTTTNQAITILEDTVGTIAPLVSDADGDAITLRVLTGPLHGVVSFNGSNFVYTPFANYNGTDGFDYEAHDNFGGTNFATISIAITPVNDAPSAASQAVSTSEDTAVNITLVATDVESPSLALRIVTGPTNGTLSGTIPNLTYTPNADFNGLDSFTFVANDGETDGNVATITITVTAVNDPPVAQAQAVTTAEEQPVAITLRGSDPEGGSLYYMVPGYPAHGSLSGIQSNLVYTPAPNYFGTDTITFKVSDGTNQSAEATVTITITPVPDAPVVSSRNLTTPEDTTLAITLPATDWDLDPLTISIVTGPAHGTVTGTGRDVIYAPNPNFNGTDSFSFKASDGTFDSNTGIISIAVSAVADAPVANALSLTTAEDSAISFSPSGSDADGDALTFEVTTQPTHGTLDAVGTNYTYSPAANYAGNDTLTFRAFDGTSWSEPATILITVTPVDDPPVASSQSVTVAEDGTRAITLGASDVDSQALTYSITTPPAHGTLSGTLPNVTYQPDANYNGADSFTFRVTDGNTFSAPATVSITVTAINDAPTAPNRTFSVDEDAPLNFTLGGSDVDGDTLTARLVSSPNSGTIATNGNSFTYTPNANFNGTDSFFYTVNDGSVDGNTASVIITVAAVDDAPVANAQSVTTAEDTSKSVTLTASDVDGGPITWAISTAPEHGTLTGTAPNLVYQPAANFFGSDSFAFRVSNGTAQESYTTVSITVTPVNDAPVANAQSVTTAEDVATAITLAATDVEGDALTFSIVTPPSHGTLSGTAPNLTYTPAANYNGSDSFTFRANDGSAFGNTAVVSITVSAANDAPVANAQSVTVTYNTAQAITLTGSDADGNPLTYSIVSGPANGTLSGTAPNLTYTPTIGYAGADSFTFRANDGSANSGVATVSITVQNPSSTPTAPSGLTATAVSSSQINLSWIDNSNNEDGFRIERSINGSSWSEIGTVGLNVSNFSSTGLSANKTYYYRVRAYNRLGNSAYSSTASAKTLK